MGVQSRMMEAERPPLPPFTTVEAAVPKVRFAEDAWNTRDPKHVARWPRHQAATGAIAPNSSRAAKRAYRPQANLNPSVVLSSTCYANAILISGRSEAARKRSECSPWHAGLSGNHDNTAHFAADHGGNVRRSKASKPIAVALSEVWARNATSAGAPRRRSYPRSLTTCSC